MARPLHRVWQDGPLGLETRSPLAELRRVGADSPELAWHFLLLRREVKLEITSDGLWASLCIELVPGLVDFGPEEATGTSPSDRPPREFHPL